MNKYQSEIEKLLQKSEESLSNELLESYQSVYNEVNDQVRQLVEDAEKLNFSQKMQAERLKLIKQQLQISIEELQSVNNRKIYNYLDTVGQTGYNELFIIFTDRINFAMLFDDNAIFLNDFFPKRKQLRFTCLKELDFSITRQIHGGGHDYFCSWEIIYSTSQ